MRTDIIPNSELGWGSQVEADQNHWTKIEGGGIGRGRERDIGFVCETFANISSMWGVQTLKKLASKINSWEIGESNEMKTLENFQNDFKVYWLEILKETIEKYIPSLKPVRSINPKNHVRTTGY